MFITKLSEAFFFVFGGSRIFALWGALLDFDYAIPSIRTSVLSPRFSDVLLYSCAIHVTNTQRTFATQQLATSQVNLSRAFHFVKKDNIQAKTADVSVGPLEDTSDKSISSFVESRIQRDLC